jgi:hypothetical protein
VACVAAALWAPLLIGTVASPAAARAEPRVPVRVLRPLPTSALLAEAILRIKSELLAGGFMVEVTDSESADPGPEARALMERSGQGLAPSATIGIFGDLDRGPAELWVVDHITGKPVTLRLEVQASADRRISEILAIRAVELLRASLVELRLEEQRPTPAKTPPPPQVQHEVGRAVAAPLAPWSLALEIGASTFGGWGGLGPTLAPAARLRLALGERFWLRLTGLGLGTSSSVQTDLGAASVSQNLVLLELAAWLRPRRVLRPMISLGLGAERVAVEGSTGSPSYLGAQHARWFLAGDVGAGVSLRLGTHWELQLEAHALCALPRPAVRFLDVEVAWTGQPTLLAILTLAGGA